MEIVKTTEYLVSIDEQVDYLSIKDGYVLCPDGNTIANVIGFDNDIGNYFVFISGAKCFIDGNDYKKVVAYLGNPNSKSSINLPNLPEITENELPKKFIPTYEVKGYSMGHEMWVDESFAMDHIEEIKTGNIEGYISPDQIKIEKRLKIVDSILHGEYVY